MPLPGVRRGVPPGEAPILAELVRWSPQGYPLVPHFAKAWEISANQRVFTIELRRGVRWSDGQPLTADDIVYWYEHEIRYFNLQPEILPAGGTLGRVTQAAVRLYSPGDYALTLPGLLGVSVPSFLFALVVT